MSPGVRDLGQDLVDLGIALGILVQGAGGPELNAAWFQDPAARLTAVLRDPAQRQAALDLARRALGEATPDDLDLRELPDGESWLPLVSSGTVPGGIYTVVGEDGGDVWLGLGARVAAHDTPGGVRLNSSATLLLPLVRFPASGPALLLLGSPGGVVRIGAAVDAPDGLAGGGAADLRGAAVDAEVPTDGTAAPTLSVALKGLRLPGEPERDLVISDPSQLDSEAAHVAAGLLAARAGAATGKLAHLLALIGLRPDPDGTIPPLPVAELAVRGLPALDAWVRSLIAHPGVVQAWLGELAALAGADAPTDGADGTEDKPFEVGVGASPRVSLLLRVTRDPGSGVTVLRPGVRIEASGTLGRAIGEAELGAVRLSSPPAGLALPKLLAVVALEGTPGTPLAEATVDGLHVVVGALRAGVALDERRAPVPVLEARNASIDGTPHELIDLTSADAVAGAVADLAGALTSALTSRPEGRALAALSGLVRPEGVAAGDIWPPLVEPARLLADPVRAVADYHVAVLAQAGAWARLARELAVLVRAAGLPAATVTGSGTATSPWVVRLAQDARGSVDLLAWSDAGPRLHLGARAALAPLAIGGKQLTLEARSELLSLALPGPTAWAPAHSLAATLAEGLVLDPGPVALLARSVSAGIAWTAGTGMQPRVRIEQPRLRIDGTEAPLPEIDWDGTGLPADPAELPWEALESLAGQALEALGGPLARLALLAGWVPGAAPVSVRPPQLPEVELSLDPGLLPRLSLQLLVGDPVGALQLWGGELLRSEQALPALAWLSDGTLSGSGTPDDPWALRPLASAPELLLWLEPDGPSLAATPELVDHLLPAIVDADNAAELLARAAVFVPELDDLLAARPLLADQLAALRSRLEQGDGIVRAADAAPAGGPWSTVSVAAGHLDLPAAFDPADLPAGAPPAGRHVYLCAPLPGVHPFPGQTAEIDLTSPGLPPEGFDLSGIPASGPWHLLLPTRDAAGGFAGVVDRTRRALGAIRAAAGGPVCLIAHSTAGLAARALAAEDGVSHLVTVGTPHAGAALDVFAPGDLAEALRALLGLRDLVGDPDAPLGDVLRGPEVAADGWLPGPDGRARRDPWPGADFVPPPFGPLHSGVTAAVAVVGQTDPDAFAGLLRAALETAASRLGGFDPLSREPAAVGFGLRHAAGPAGLRLDLGPERRLRARATVQRDGGWLAGDAGQGPGPRVRWAEAELDARLEPRELEARLVLHEASVLGVRAREWAIGADSLSPEARVLIGELARGLGPLPATGPLAALGDLLTALDLVEVAGDRTVTVVPAALERLLLDPAGVLRERLAAPGSALPAALAALLGAPAPAADGSLALPLAAGVTLALAPQPAPHATLRASAPPVSAELTLEADGRLSGSATALSRGRPRQRPGGSARAHARRDRLAARFRRPGALPPGWPAAIRRAAPDRARVGAGARACARPAAERPGAAPLVGPEPGAVLEGSRRLAGPPRRGRHPGCAHPPAGRAAGPGRPDRSRRRAAAPVGPSRHHRRRRRRRAGERRLGGSGRRRERGAGRRARAAYRPRPARDPGAVGNAAPAQPHRDRLAGARRQLRRASGERPPARPSRARRFGGRDPAPAGRRRAGRAQRTRPRGRAPGDPAQRPRCRRRERSTDRAGGARRG